MSASNAYASGGSRSSTARFALKLGVDPRGEPDPEPGAVIDRAPGVEVPGAFGVDELPRGAFPMDPRVRRVPIDPGPGLQALLAQLRQR